MRIKLEPKVELSPDYLSQALKEEIRDMEPVVTLAEEFDEPVQTVYNSNWEDFVVPAEQTLTKSMSWEEL